MLLLHLLKSDNYSSKNGTIKDLSNKKKTKKLKDFKISSQKKDACSFYLIIIYIYKQRLVKRSLGKIQLWCEWRRNAGLNSIYLYYKTFIGRNLPALKQ